MNRPYRSVLFLLIATTISGCAADQGKRAPTLPPGTQARSLLGEPLYAPPLPSDEAAKHSERLAAAQEAYEAAPHDEGTIIWLGRRLAYLGRYREAIDVYSRGLVLHPASYRLRRHRGHRFITLREFDSAVDDLQQASSLIRHVPDEVEQDGLPNAMNIPTSTTHTNIFYHLGLAHYLRGEYSAAADALMRCLTFANNHDMEVATRYWLYLTQRRAEDDAAAAETLAAVREDWAVIENSAYHDLLLMFAGMRQPTDLLDKVETDDIADATTLYGIGAWRRLNGDAAGAADLFRRITDTGMWPAFGYIAAEADLAR